MLSMEELKQRINLENVPFAWRIIMWEILVESCLHAVTCFTFIV
ncbi:hypothetical protein LINPERPRIM_LOCUS20970 [Linum perenne]